MLDKNMDVEILFAFIEQFINPIVNFLLVTTFNAFVTLGITSSFASNQKKQPLHTNRA